MKIPRRDCIALVGSAFSILLWVSAPAQEGYLGTGHHKWHQDFYSKLKRNDGQGSCCNLMDCRPTQSRTVGDHYEVKVDGEWMPVPNDKIINVVAPDGGAHVCAPRQVGRNKGVYLCHSPAGGLTRIVLHGRRSRWQLMARSCRSPRSNLRPLSGVQRSRNARGETFSFWTRTGHAGAEQSTALAPSGRYPE